MHAIRQIMPPLRTLALAPAIACLIVASAGCGHAVDQSVDDLIITFRRDHQIWTALGDGTGQKQLTDGYDSSPAVSPDGKTIVYQHSVGDPRMIWVDQASQEPGPAIGLCAIPTTGGEPKLITPASWLTGSGWVSISSSNYGAQWIKRGCFDPSFSPDGKTICFIIRDTVYFNPGDIRGFHAIAIMNADGTSAPRVLLIEDDQTEPRKGNVSNPRFSPDGSEIYVCHDHNELEEIYRVSVKSGKLTQVTPKSVPPRNPMYGAFDIDTAHRKIASTRWSSAPGSEHISIVVMGMNAENISAIYTEPDPYSEGEGPPDLPYIDCGMPPSFTKDGNVIAFTSEGLGVDYFTGRQSPTPDIYIIPINGGTPTKIIVDGDQPCFGKKVSE